MTKRDFFRVIIKLFGLYQLLIIIFQALPKFFEIAYFDVDILIVVLYAVIIFGVIVSIFVLLIFKVDKVIDWLRLDVGFDENRIQFENFNSIQIIKLAIILISGVMLLDNVSDFLYLSYQVFKNSVNDGLYSGINFLSMSMFDYSHWVVTGINIVVAYLMLSNYRSLASWIDSKTSKIQN